MDRTSQGYVHSIIFMKGMRSQLKPGLDRRSRSMISRLVYGSIKTGSATATVSVLALVLFLAVLSIQGPLRMLLADNGSGFSSLPGISTGKRRCQAMGSHC